MILLDTINDALETIGAKSATDEPKPEETAQALRVLNRIIDGYNIQNLTIPYLEDIEIPTPEPPPTDPEGVTSLNFNVKTDGGGYQKFADVNTDDFIVPTEELFFYIFNVRDPQTGDRVRFNAMGQYLAVRGDAPVRVPFKVTSTWKIDDAPVHIAGIYWYDERSGTRYESKEMTYTRWLSYKYLNTEAIPAYHYIQKTNTNEVILNFDCIPQSDLTLHILAKMPYTGVNGRGEEYIATDDIMWTRGMEKMLMYRLAVELCPLYEIDPNPILVGLAQEAENYLKASNYQPTTLKTSTKLSRGYRYNNSRCRDNPARY